MVTVNAHYDGKSIVLDEPLSFAPNQKLRVTIETVEPATPVVDKAPRQFGLQRGVLISIAPDFDDELGDDFWFGEKK